MRTRTAREPRNTLGDRVDDRRRNERRKTEKMAGQVAWLSPNTRVFEYLNYYYFGGFKMILMRGAMFGNNSRTLV